jgi:hypothetical protein
MPLICRSEKTFMRNAVGYVTEIRNFAVHCVNELGLLLRHGSHIKWRLQEFYCCVYLLPRERIFAESLPNTEGGGDA